jgi:hypothetical protein
MIQTESMLPPLFGLCLALALAAGGAASPAPLSAATLDCPNCIASNVCADIESSGTSACKVTRETGCQEELGLCICGNCETLVAAVRQEPGVLYDTPFGKTQLVHVGENRFALWDCKGRLAFLVEKAPDGTISEVPVRRFRNTYSLRRVLTGTASQAE